MSGKLSSKGLRASTTPAHEDKQPVPRQGLPATDEELRLRQAKDALNVSLDHLNQALASAEKALRHLRLKTSASVVLEYGECHDGHQEVTRLAFRELAKDWGLVIESGIDGVEDTFTEKPLLKAPRRLRLRAAESLDELWGEILTTLERERIRAVRATKRATSFAERLGAIAREEQIDEDV